MSGNQNHMMLPSFQEKRTSDDETACFFARSPVIPQQLARVSTANSAWLGPSHGAPLEERSALVPFTANAGTSFELRCAWLFLRYFES